MRTSEPENGSSSYHETRGYQAHLPKPLMEFLGNPETIKFMIKGKKVEVHPQK
jgi:hypothetical protein